MKTLNLLGLAIFTLTLTHTTSSYAENVENRIVVLEKQVKTLSSKLSQLEKALLADAGHLLAYQAIANKYNKKIDNGLRSREASAIDILVLRNCLSQVAEIQPESLQKFSYIKLHDSYNAKVALSDFYESAEDRTLLFFREPTLQACLNALIVGDE